MNTLELRIVMEDGPQVRPFIDGRDFLAEAFTEGPGYGPANLPNLRAGDEPRTVCLAEAACTVGCCGALYVTIRREGDEVVWGGWHNPD